MSAEFKVCPSCGEEFMLTVSECSECGIPLALPGEIAAPESPEAFPEISELACVRVGPLPWTRALSEALGQAEIGHRVERDARAEAEGGVDRRRFGGETVFGTWVKPADLEAARQVDASIFSHLEPDNEALAEGDEACPACEEAVPPEAVECPGCGLAFG